MFNCFLSIFINVEVSDLYVKGLSIIVFFSVNLNFIYLIFCLFFLFPYFLYLYENKGRGNGVRCKVQGI
jgi:hypothetical protein